MDSAFERLGHQMVRFRWLVLALWLGLLVVGALGARGLPDVLTGGGFDAPNSESAQAAQLLRTEFPGEGAHTALLVFRADGQTADRPEYRAAVERIAGDVATLPGVSGVLTAYSTNNSRFMGRDDHISFAIVTLAPTDPFEASKVVPEVRAAVAGADLPDWLTTQVTGAPAVEHDVTEASAADLVEAERIGLPITLLLLILAFGALAAAGLPILVGIGAIVVTMGIAYLLGQVTDLSSSIMNAVPMLGLGVGIDYCLFIVSRYREELAAGRNSHDAVVRTVATAGKAVAFSGLTVAIGLSALLVPNLMMLRSVGLGGIVVVAVAVAAALTLLPALLAVLGHRVNALRLPTWPVRRLGPAPEGLWHRWAFAVMRRPVLSVVGALLVLGALATPALRMQTLAPGATLLPEGAESRQAFVTLAEGFGPGEMGPIEVVVDTGRNAGLWTDESIAALYTFSKRIEADSRVARVDGIVSIDPSTTLPDYRRLYVGGLDPSRDPRLAAAVPMVSAGGGATVLRVVPAVDPDSLAGRAVVEKIRTDVVTGVDWPSGTRVLVGGSTASSLDMERELYGSFPLVLALVLGMSFVVLAILLRSIVLPLKAIAMNALSVLASYGLLVLIFQDGFGTDLMGFAPPGAITSLIPVFLFCILFGLSMDYEIFILSRMREAYEETGSNEQGVALGLERTGRIVTSAALIMVSVFGAFALSRFVLLKEMGIGMSAAVLLDATLIRVLLVPATMRLLGRWNWWAPRFLRSLPSRGRDAASVPGQAD